MECQFQAKIAKLEEQKAEAIRTSSHWYKVAHANAAKLVELEARVKESEAAMKDGMPHN